MDFDWIHLQTKLILWERHVYFGICDIAKNNRMKANIMEAEWCTGVGCKRDSKPDKKYWMPAFCFLWKLSLMI